MEVTLARRRAEPLVGEFEESAVLGLFHPSSTSPDTA
jgi:hypothetical protein